MGLADNKRIKPILSLKSLNQLWIHFSGFKHITMKKRTGKVEIVFGWRSLKLARVKKKKFLMCVSVLKAANAKCVCVVTALSFVQVQPGQMRIDRPLMPSAANKWIIENPVVTPPRPVSEMRHSHLSTPMTQPEIDFVLVFVWVTERWIYSLTFIVSVTLFTYSFSYFLTQWQWCCCFPWCQFCICAFAFAADLDRAGRDPCFVISTVPHIYK